MNKTTGTSWKDEDEIDFSYFFNQILEHKWFILIITSICLSLGIVYSMLLKPVYEADILVQIEENRSAAKGIGQLTDQLFQGGAKNNVAEIQKALIKSRFILNPVIKSLKLDTRVTVEQSRFQRWFNPVKAQINMRLFNIPNKLMNQPFQLVYDKKNHVILYDHLHHEILSGKTNTHLYGRQYPVQIEITDIKAPIGTRFTIVKHPQTNIIHALIGQLKIEDLGGKQSIGLLDISFKDHDPARAVNILNKIAEVVQTEDAKQKSLEASQTLNFLDQQLPIARKSLEEAEFKLNQYRAKSGKIDMKMQTQALLERLADLDKELAKLQIKKIDMSLQFTEQHPAFIALNQKIDGFVQDKHRLENVLKTLPESDQVAVNLIRDVKVKTVLYTMLLNKIQELQVIKAGTVSDVRILSKAKIPNTPLPGKKSAIYAISTLLGLIASLLFIFSRKLLFPRVEDPHYSEKHFNIVNLAIIPYSDEQFDRTHGLNTNRKHIPLLAEINPRNLSIESLRSLRTSLQVNLSCASNNIIAILGVCPGVGKTFVSTNLAYLLATAGKKVLLIDADLRRGSAHKYFNFLPALGLAECIQGAITPEQAIKTTSHPNLQVLTRGDYPADPSELLANPRCKEIIQQLAQDYDIVIIDTAPVLLVTDAVLVGSISATNYLVLGSKVHQPSDIEIVIKRLTAAGVHVHGSIFNFHNASSKRNPYYYKYNAYNYYYDDTNEKKRKTGQSKKPVVS